jgi:hypothetical protein
MNQVAYDFSEVALGIELLYSKRGVLVAAGFDQLCSHRPALAKTLIAMLDGRRRAERWLSSHHPKLHGQTAWQTLAVSDEQLIWDVLATAGTR